MGTWVRDFSVEEARKHLGDLIRRAQGDEETIYITMRGEPAVMLTPLVRRGLMYMPRDDAAQWDLQMFGAQARALAREGDPDAGELADALDSALGNHDGRGSD